MFQIRPAAERGVADHGWLQTRHSFSFAGYHDPRYDQFRSLRVMNEDWIAPGQGFGTHPHRDMEILTYVLSGTLEHRDSLGHGEVLRAGELQRMSAGSGIQHSEFNPSASEPVHLYQIWLLPARKGIAPSYEQRRFPATQREGQWQLVASPDGAGESLRIEQAARVYMANVAAGSELTLPVSSEPYAWLQVLRGRGRVAQQALSAGDGLAISDEVGLSLVADEALEVLLFALN
jgi:redox-sensitive bicupin YhaK (pirin superfamily)